MKTLVAALAAAAGLFTLAAAAALPNTLNFQGKLLDPATNAPKDGTFSIAFRIYDGAGNVLWGPETHGAVAVTNGVFSVQLGSIVSLTPQVFSNGDTRLGVTVGADSEMSPRQQLVMSPYAFTAAQLANSGSLRLNAGVVYSTFTAEGNFTAPYGVVAGTASFSGALTASSGTFTATSIAAVTASSNVVATGGMIDARGPGGLRAAFGVLAATASFTSTTEPSIRASSNVVVSGGMLDVQGPARVTGTLRSETMLSGRGAEITGASPQVAQSSGSASVTLTAGAETVVISTTIAPLSADRRIAIQGYVHISRGANSSPTVTVRVRRAIGGACGTGSTEVYAYSAVRGNVNPSNWPFPVLALDSPNTTSPVEYCLTVTDAAADSYTNRSLMLFSGAP